MSKPDKNKDKANNKGNSGNTNGGTETSFKNTPQAKDDVVSSESFGALDYGSLVYKFDILANDLGGNSKSLWSVDDGINDSGAMDGYVAGDLLTQDFAGTEEYGQAGAMLSLTSDGQIAYDAANIESDLAALAQGQVLTDNFIYAIRMANGTLSWAEASFSITGINDAPTLAFGALSTNEDSTSSALDLSSLGDDVDSDDDGSTLLYNIIGTTPGGLASIAGTDFLFDPSGDFEYLAVDQSISFGVDIEATDSHGATASSTVTVTINGVNDDPTLAAGALAATEDGASVSLDLSSLGDDIDSDNDGSNLTYSLLTTAAGGTASISGATLNLDPSGDFQSLAAGETTTFDLGVRATDAHGGTADNTVTVTVTGVNDAPEAESVSIAAVEDGASVAGSFVGDDIDSDDDGSTLTYAIAGTPTAGSISNNGDGTFSFDPGADFQSLAAGEETAINLSYTATDSHGTESAPASLTINVTGVNDDPTLAAGALAATEDGASVSLDLSSLGDDIDSDNDGSDLIYTVDNIGGKGYASVIGNNLTFGTAGDFDFLAEGETTIQELEVTATDSHGAEATNIVSVTVTGVNDPTYVTGGDETGAVTLTPGQTPFTVEQWTNYSGSYSQASLIAEAGNRTADYTITSNIIDFTDDPSGFSGELPGSSPWPAAVATGASGTGATVNNNFFARITANILITESDTYTFRTFNDDGVYLSVNNQLIINDPTEHGEAAFEGEIDLEPGIYPIELYFFENGGEASLELSFKNSSGIYQLVETSNANASGVLTFIDADLTDTHSVSTTALGDAQGSLVATIDTDTTGSGSGGQVSWEYQISNDAYASLAAGETTVESFMVSIDDGNSGGDTLQQVDITITGANDVAEIGTAVVDVIETDAEQTVSGVLSISDVDNGEAFFNPQTDTEGTYGSFSIAADGNWSFTTDGALDYLAEGETVSEFFTVSSLDGTESTVTVNITGTADGPTAENDSNSLAASNTSVDTDNTVYWVDWTSATVDSQNGSRNPTYTVEGTITLSDRTVGVSYHGQAAEPWGVVPGVQYNDVGSEDYYIAKSGSTITSTEGVGVFTSPEVGNGPTNNDIIRLHHADSPRTLSFSEPVENLFFAIVSMNNNGYLFDQNFEVVSSADSSTDAGYFGYAVAWEKTNPEAGRYGITTDPTITGVPGQTEFHGVLAINNALESLTWESQADENWNAFTIGTYGVAQSATVSGNVLSNDDPGTALPVEVVDVSGSAMLGSSVTLNLTSGAILKVDSDGDYLYDDNGAFAYLAEGETHLDTVTYTVEDSNGNSDSATLSIVVNGVNDAPQANDDSATVVENSSITIDVLGNDTDADAGDVLSIQSVVSNGLHGSAVIDANANTVLYTPNPDYFGADSFSYTTVDTAGAVSSATVNVEIVREAETLTVHNLISNGSFESGNAIWSTYNSSYRYIPDAADGNRVMELDRPIFSGDPYVQQSIYTTPGEQYTVGYAIAAESGDSAYVVTTINGWFADSASFDKLNSSSNLMWDNHSFTFTASGNISYLRFTDDSWSFYNETYIDEVVMLSNESINWFDKSLGDELDFRGLLSSIDAPHSSAAFSSGFLNFQASGNDTIIQIDPDGGGDSYLDSITLVGVSLTAADVDNYIL